jgi:hypothetical protein
VRYRRMIRLLVAFGLLVSSTALMRAQVAPVRAAMGVAARVDWLRIDPRDPRVLYVGGTLSTLYVGGQSWMSRSSDGGDTFADLSKGLGFFDLPYGYNQPTTAVLEPLEIGPSSGDLYTIATYYDGNAKARLPNTALLRSTDGGAHWQRGEETISRVVTSPFSSTRLYGHLQDDNIVDSANGDVPYERHSTVVVSNDGGRHFTATSLRDASDLVADPTHPDTVYANGGGGMYRMQFFEHARLELHPEAHDPRYAVQVGLLGLDALRDRAWLTTS